MTDKSDAYEGYEELRKFTAPTLDEYLKFVQGKPWLNGRPPVSWASRGVERRSAQLAKIRKRSKAAENGTPARDAHGGR